MHISSTCTGCQVDALHACSLSPPPHQHKGQSATHEQIENLKLDIKLKDADSRFLQDELDKKERIMDELTEGLKEVCA
jgi:hypothetical protein